MAWYLPIVHSAAAGFFLPSPSDLPSLGLGPRWTQNVFRWQVYLYRPIPIHIPIHIHIHIHIYCEWLEPHTGSCNLRIHLQKAKVTRGLFPFTAHKSWAARIETGSLFPATAMVLGPPVKWVIHPAKNGPWPKNSEAASLPSLWLSTDDFPPTFNPGPSGATCALENKCCVNPGFFW